MKIPPPPPKTQENSSQSLRERQSNFELVRIFAMFFIVLFHSIHHGLRMHLEISSCTNTLLINSLSHLGSLGNLLFMLIAGYFLTGANFSCKKIALLYGRTFFYTAILGVAFYATRFPCMLKYGLQSAGPSFNAELAPCDKADLVRAVVPLFFGGNWFILTYIIFYIFAPFLNKMIFSISQKQHAFLAIFLFSLAAVFPMIPYCAVYSVQDGQAAHLFLFFCAFCISSYIKLYGIKFFEQKLRVAVLAAIAFFVLIFLRLVIFLLLSKTKIPILSSLSLYPAIVTEPISSMNSVPIFGLAILIFCAFKNLKMKSSKIINAVGSATMAIYVIHENDIMKNVLWLKFLKVSDFFEKPPAVFLASLFSLALFAFCVFASIEILRKKIFQKFFQNFATKNKANEISK